MGVYSIYIHKTLNVTEPNRTQHNLFLIVFKQFQSVSHREHVNKWKGGVSVSVYMLVMLVDMIEISITNF